MDAIAIDRPREPTWTGDFHKAWEGLKLFATIYSYGGKGIVTNRLKAGGTEPLNAGWGLNPSGLTAADTDTALFDPAPEARVAGTSSQQTTNANVPNDTYQDIATITSTSGGIIREYGQFDTAVAAPQTVTTAAIASGVTSVGVLANAGFPGSGTYYIQVDNEVMAVTGGQGSNTWTVTRAARGSTAAAHASGANIVGGEATTGGNLFFKGDFGAITLNAGDAIQFTSRTQFT